MQKGPVWSVTVLIALIALALTLTGCVTLSTPTVVDTSCAAFQPIRYSGSALADQPDVLRQLKAHNAVWLELCGGG